MNPYNSMDREGLLKALEMFAKNWLAHDGCWFLAAEEKLGMEAAIELDARAWQRFAEAEGRRIAEFLGLPKEGGLEALAKALEYRMYALINEQHIEWCNDGQDLTFVMDRCRVQETRRRKGLSDFPCLPVGKVEFKAFAQAVDPRIEVECRHCPPDAPAHTYCSWSFRLKD
jgi:Family of unknown function (DUF6125)